MINKVKLLGRVYKDPEYKKFESGRKKLNLMIYTHDAYYDKKTDETKATTSFHQIVVWGEHTKSLSKEIKKGDEVLVLGKLESRRWKDKETDEKYRYTVEINAETIKKHEVSL